MNDPPAPPPIASSRCPTCGHELPPSQTVCPACGRSLIAPPPQVSAPPLASTPLASPPPVAVQATKIPPPVSGDEQLPEVEVKQTKSRSKRQADTVEQTATTSEPTAPRKLSPEQRERIRKRTRIVIALFSAVLLLVTYLVLLALS